MVGEQETKIFVHSQKLPGRVGATLALLLWALPALLPPARGQSLPRLDPPVFLEEAGQPLSMPWVGGLNNPQPGNVDLNEDGRPDLLIFDRHGNVLLPFLNTPQGYRFAPDFRAGFPPMENWMLLRDFNGDGIADLFTYSARPGVDGIRAFRGYYDEHRIAFRPVRQLAEGDLLSYRLPSGSETNIYISRIDYPEVADVDCDSDLDLLSFNVAGGYVEFYRNTSVEEGFGLDSLRFSLADDCWGGFFESGIGKAVDLAAPPGQCAGRTDPQPGVVVRHAGSTLLTLDPDGDHLRDLILGDLSFNNLNYLTNGGDCSRSWMNAQDTAFPASRPVAIDFFPASFLVDVTRDGLPELVAAPNASGEGENRQVFWVYENLAPPGSSAIWSFQQSDGFVAEMVDQGSGLSPAFADIDQDGLIDLVTGNGYIYRSGGDRRSSLQWYRNVGTAAAPAFVLQDDDLGELARFNPEYAGFAPHFADLDGDGDQDLLVGEERGGLFYAENTAGPGQPMQFGAWQYPYLDIDVGLGSVPATADVNGDGRLDLVVGERNGNLNLFLRRAADQVPPYPSSPDDDFWGAVDARRPGSLVGYSAPAFFSREGGLRMLLGTQAGFLELYEPGTTGPFPLLDEDFGQLREGFQLRPALADIDGDRLLELVVGNARGGLSLFQTALPAEATVATKELAAEIRLQVFPNPSPGPATLVFDADLGMLRGEIRLWDVQGRLHTQLPLEGTDTPLPPMPAGVYFVEVLTPKGRGRCRWVVY